MTILETERLTIRGLRLEDAGFILELLNEPAWLQFIGDRGVRTLEDARGYIVKSSSPGARPGLGVYLAELKADRAPLGVCSLLKRDTLKDVDIGFAFLSRHWGKGYAYEATAAVMAYAKSTLGLGRLVAIASPENHRSHKLLEKLGLHLEGRIRLTPGAEEIAFFADRG